LDEGTLDRNAESHIRRKWQSDPGRIFGGGDSLMPDGGDAVENQVG
jgi:hypothetical protein